MANKIKYGLRNVYFAVATIAANGSATYTAPKRIPGAVNLTLDAEGDTSTFYADDIAYWEGVANNGYSGSLEIARVPEDFETDILGMIEDGTGGLIEDAGAPTKHFALLFEFQGDESATRHCMYNCTATRPSVASATKAESIEPQTETLNLTARSIWNAHLTKDIVKMKAASTHSAYANWFTAVYQPTAGVVSTE